MTDHEERERLAKIAESMRDSCPDRPEETIGDYTIVPLAYSQRADFAAIARLLREPVNAKAVYALGHFMHAEIGDAILILDSDDREERADGSVVYQLKACAAAERVTRGTFDEMAAEAKRLTARVQWLEAECARWKFDADTTREAHICTHRRAEKIEAENARLRAPRVGVESALRKIAAWLVCWPITTPEDMAQSFAEMSALAEKALDECWPAAGKGE